MKKIMFLCLAVLFLLPFSTEAKSAKKTNTDIYQNEQYNFQINLPSGWITSFMQENDVVLKTSSVTSEGAVGTIAIYAKNLANSPHTDYNQIEPHIMQTLVDDAVTKVKNEKTLVNMRYARYININGNRFVVLYYTFGSDNDKMDIITATTVVNSTEYNILLETNDYTDSMIDQYYQSLTSFNTLTKTDNTASKDESQ